MGGLDENTGFGVYREVGIMDDYISLCVFCPGAEMTVGASWHISKCMIAECTCPEFERKVEEIRARMRERENKEKNE